MITPKVLAVREARGSWGASAGEQAEPEIRAAERVVTAAAFKAQCLAEMDHVANTGESIVITKRGKPVARLVPIHAHPDTLLGFGRGLFEDVGDVVSPVNETWDAAEPAAPSRDRET